MVAGRFAPAAHYAAIICKTMAGMTCWSNWAPRLGVVYDLFGNGKTALKASLGKYLRAESSAFANQFNPVFSTTESRTWSDTDRSGLNLPTNGDNIAQDNEIGPSGTSNFGALRNRSLDPNYAREYNLQYSVGVQHELRPGMAVTFNWFRRSLYNTQQQTNRGVDPTADWTTTSIVNPLTGDQIPVYQLNQSKFGNTSDLYLTTATDTNLRRNVYTGFELGTSARLPRRTLVFAGWTLERTVDVNCAMNITSASFFYNDPNSLRYCDQSGSQFQDLGQNAAIPSRRRPQRHAEQRPPGGGLPRSRRSIAIGGGGP